MDRNLGFGRLSEPCQPIVGAVFSCEKSSSSAQLEEPLPIYLSKVPECSVILQVLIWLRVDVENWRNVQASGLKRFGSEQNWREQDGRALTVLPMSVMLPW
jgi:hypothetical protein